MVVSTESEFEEKVIQALQSKGWEKEVLRYPTEQDLIDNWAQILFENNRQVDRLGDAPLTDTEMAQILEQVKELRTSLRLNGFINGKTVSITRDNPDDPTHLGKEVCPVEVVVFVEFTVWAGVGEIDGFFWGHGYEDLNE